MRIRFLSDQIYETAGPGKGPKLAAGTEVDLVDVGDVIGRPVAPEFAASWLQRWLQRGVAELVDGSHAAPVSEGAAPGDGAGEGEDEGAGEGEDAVGIVDPATIVQPLGTAKRGRPTRGVDN
jgi:hypothetical protein